MLPHNYNVVFKQNIHHFCIKYINRMWSRKEQAYEDRFSLFYPVIGKDYLAGNNLLVVGQATNGWLPQFTCDDIRLRDEEILELAINYSNEDGSKCPLDWLNEEWTNKQYSLYRSFFWNVTYKLIKQFYNRNDNNWNHVIAWSNLMKIAPAEGGNPDELLIECQQETSAELFQQEIRVLQPRNVLLMTNLKTWAQPIFERLGLKYEKVDGRFVEAVAYLNDTKIIVTKRGYLKVTHQEAVSDIIKHLTK